MWRALFVVVLIAGSVRAEQILVQDGDYYPTLAVSPNDVLMTGGRVDRLVTMGNLVEVEGGSMGGGEIYAGTLELRGGQVSGVYQSWYNTATLRFTGPYFRVWDQGASSSNHWKIEGFLADGEFVSLDFFHDRVTSFVTLEFDLSPGDAPTGDIDGDWDIDLVDLNVVRNNFADPYTLDDLNAVRNDFGFGAQFTVEPTHGVVVPEPDTFSLLLFFTLVSFFMWKK